MVSIIFVCTGNICRSPTAEAVFRDRVRKMNIDTIYDSAGTHGYHIGESPDDRSVDVGQANSIDINNLFARRLEQGDFDRFDLLIAMDKSHEQALHGLCMDEAQYKKIKLLLDYCPDHRGMDVPDPYYGYIKEFEKTYSLIERGVDAPL